MVKSLDIIYQLEEIDTIAQGIIQQFNDCKIFTLTGDLGAGKTRLVTAMSAFLGYTGNVSSPTFSIVNEYSIPNGTIYHFDLYRLKNTDEALDIGFEEYLYSGAYCFIEWPEKVAHLLPPSFVIHINLSYLANEKRQLKAWRS
jgi:tRNA threonylcarbamoyladenosine biosynthesis protein TsaE